VGASPVSEPIFSCKAVLKAARRPNLRMDHIYEFSSIETVSEGMDNDLRHVTFSSFWKLEVTSFDRMKKSCRLGYSPLLRAEGGAST